MDIIIEKIHVRPPLLSSMTVDSERKHNLAQAARELFKTWSFPTWSFPVALETILTAISKVHILVGCGGSGKTSVVNAIIQRPNQGVCLMASTGQAALNFSPYIDTVHSTAQFLPYSNRIKPFDVNHRHSHTWRLPLCSSLTSTQCWIRLRSWHSCFQYSRHSSATQFVTFMTII
jgi:hypothetical protein